LRYNKQDEYSIVMSLIKVYLPVERTQEKTFPIHFISPEKYEKYTTDYGGEESYYDDILPKKVQRRFNGKTEVNWKDAGVQVDVYKDDLAIVLANQSTTIPRIVVLSKMFDIEPSAELGNQLIEELREYIADELGGDIQASFGKRANDYITRIETQLKRMKQAPTPEEKPVALKPMKPLDRDMLLFSQGSKAARIELPRYVLANRKEFPSFIRQEFETKMQDKSLKFLPSRVWVEDKQKFIERAPFEQQRFVSYFLSDNTPYRGLLLYHGLGSGKSGASVLIAEGFRNRRVCVLLPASLHSNYSKEIHKFGEVAYRRNFFWEFIELPYDSVSKRIPDDVVSAMKELGIDEDLIHRIILKNKTKWGVFMINYEKEKPNYDDLPDTQKRLLNKQIEIMVDYKYTILHYNAGMHTVPKILESCLPSGVYRNILRELFDDPNKSIYTSNSISKIMNYIYDPEKKIANPFDNRVIIIDEVHNLTSHLMGESYTIGYIYEMIMRAKDVKLVFLSGTPVINYDYELALLYNMLVGLIHEYTLPIKKKNEKEAVKKADIERIMDSSQYVDRYRVDSRDGHVSFILVPSGFQNKFSEGRKRYLGVEPAVVRYTDEQMVDQVILELSKGGYKVDFEAIKEKVYTIFPDILRHDTESAKLLTSKKGRKLAPTSFRALYPNIMMGDTSFKREAENGFRMIPTYKASFRDRIQGYTSYYHEITGIHEETGSELFPEKIVASPEETTVKMSDYQFMHYGAYRYKEQYQEQTSDVLSQIKQDNTGKMDFGKVPSSFRVFTRQTSLFVFPPNIPRPRVKKFDYNYKYTKDEISIMVKKVLQKYKKEDRYDKVVSVLGRLRDDNLNLAISIIHELYPAISKDDNEEWKRIISETEVDVDRLTFTPEEERINEKTEEKENNIDTVIQEDADIDVPTGDPCDAKYEACAKKSNKAEKDYEVEYKRAVGLLTESNLKTAESLSDGGQSVNGMTLEVLAPKYVRIMENINKTPGNVLCYSQFRNVEGIETFASVLKANGYKQYKVQQGDDEEDNKVLFKKGDYVRVKKDGDEWETVRINSIIKLSSSETSKLYKYKLSNGKEVKRDAMHACRFALWTGTESQAERERTLKMFNSKDNMFGQQCLILMITQSGAEGISLKNVRQVHIMEPYWNNVRVNQVIGRARRVESHIDLPKDQQNVKIFQYVIEFTDDQKSGKWSQSMDANLKTIEIKDLIHLMAETKQKIQNRENRGKGIKELLSSEKEEIKEVTENDRKIFISSLTEVIQKDNLITSDQTLATISIKKETDLTAYIKMIQESAVDCHFNKEANERANPEMADMKCYINMEDIQRNPYMYDYSKEESSKVAQTKTGIVKEQTSAYQEPELQQPQMVFKLFRYTDPKNPTGKPVQLKIRMPQNTDLKDVPSGTEIYDATEKNVVGNVSRDEGKLRIKFISKETYETAVKNS
jgi:hypothetical protein